LENYSTIDIIGFMKQANYTLIKSLIRPLKIGQSIAISGEPLSAIDTCIRSLRYESLFKIGIFTVKYSRYKNTVTRIK